MQFAPPRVVLGLPHHAGRDVPVGNVRELKLLQHGTEIRPFQHLLGEHPEARRKTPVTWNQAYWVMFH